MIMVTADVKVTSRIISTEGAEIIPCIIHDLSLIFTKIGRTFRIFGQYGFTLYGMSQCSFMEKM